MSDIPGYGRPGENLRYDDKGRVRDERGRVVDKNGSRHYPPDDGWRPYTPPPKKVTRNSPPTMWEEAVRLWDDLVLGFGDSIDLIRWAVMTRLYHRALGYAIRELEALIRRAIRADAREIDPSSLQLRPPRPRKLKPPRSNEEAPRAADSDDPLTWKVSFRMSVPLRTNTMRTKPPRRRRGPRPEPRDQRITRHYAYRIEAMRRAIAYRTAYTLRYARRCARREEGALADADAKRRAVEALCAVLLNDYGLPVNVDLPPGIPVRNAKYTEPG